MQALGSGFVASFLVKALKGALLMKTLECTLLVEAKLEAGVVVLGKGAPRLFVQLVRTGLLDQMA